jgi:hypothetical protein
LVDGEGAWVRLRRPQGSRSISSLWLHGHHCFSPSCGSWVPYLLHGLSIVLTSYSSTWYAQDLCPSLCISLAASGLSSGHPASLLFCSLRFPKGSPYNLPTMALLCHIFLVSHLPLVSAIVAQDNSTSVGPSTWSSQCVFCKSQRSYFN